MSNIVPELRNGIAHWVPLLFSLIILKILGYVRLLKKVFLTERAVVKGLVLESM